MKNTCSLSYSVVRRNKGFTIGLIVLFMVLTAFIIVSGCVVPSVQYTLEDYRDAYCAPDLWLLTEPLPEQAKAMLPMFPEIEQSEYSMVTDVRCRVRKKELYSLQLFSVEENGFRKYKLTDEKHTDKDLPEVMVSEYYAKANQISTGDTIELMTVSGYRDFFVSALVACPENMYCMRDFSSWYETSDYGYLYLQREVMDAAFPTAGYTNLWAFLTTESCTNEREKEILKELSGAFGSRLRSAECFDTSDIRVRLENELKQVEQASRYIPFLAYVVGLFFTALFVQQVMHNRRAMIGLLLALGYSRGQILRVFMLYVFWTGIIGIALGSGLGTVLTRVATGIYQKEYSIPYILFHTNLPVLILLSVLPLVIGLLSCIFRTGIITRMNPAAIYDGGSPEHESALPRWLRELQLPEMIKIAVVSIFRNRRRFLLSTLSIASSVMITMVTIAVSASNNAAKVAAFGSDGKGGRFRYDALIRYSGGEDFLHQTEKLDGVSVAEPVILFQTVLSTEQGSVETQVNALSENSTLIVPADPDGNPLQPGNGVILEEYVAKTLGVGVGETVSIAGTSVKVTGIAREVVNSIQYISFETANKLGCSEADEIAVRFTPGTDISAGCAAFSDLDGFRYATLREHQRQTHTSNCRVKDNVINISSLLTILLGIIIVYNMVVLNVEEKKRDYATLIALGTSVREFMSLALSDQLIRYVAAVLPGIPAGYLFAFLITNAMSGLKVTYPLVQVGMACLVTASVSLVYLLAGVLFTLIKVKAVDPAIALNARE